MRRAILILVLLLARVHPTHAQLTTITASHISDSSGNPLANGILRFTATDGEHHPISFKLPGENRDLRNVECRVVRGAITESVRGGPCQLANTSKADPPGVCYEITIIDSRTRQEFPAPVGCYLPRGSSDSLDNYPSQPPISKATHGVTSTFDGLGRLRSLKEDSAMYDNAYLFGAFNHITNDYANPNIPGSGGYYPYQVPHYNHYQSNGMSSLDDFYYTDQHDLTILGSSAFTLSPTYGLQMGPNYGSDSRNVTLYSPAQGGGFHTNKLIAHSPGDTVFDTAYVIAHGVGEGFHEGMEMYRHFMSFDLAAPQGSINLLGIDAVGREKMQIISGNELDSFGSDNILINVTKKQSPAGNVTSVSPCSDARFMCVTVDAALAGHLNQTLGGAFHQATIVAGADMQKYDGNCPANVVAPNWGNVTVDGTSAAVNPYATDYTGAGSKTTAMCLTLSGDISTLGERIPVSIWGAHENWEITGVIRKVDATHIVVPLNFPHDPGEVVSWSSGSGWGLSSDATTIPAHTLDNTTTTQFSDLHLVYPIIGWDSAHSQLWLYVNSAATGTELKLNIFAGTAAPVPGVYTPTVSGGVVTAVASNSNTYLTSTTITGVQPMLPPPTYTFGGSGKCAVDPVVHFVQAGGPNGPGYAAVLDSGGSGCPADLTIIPQSAYANPITIFPLTRIYRIQDPANGNYKSGYLLTQVLATRSQWAANDHVEMTPHWQQYAGGNEQYSYSPYVRSSLRNGPAVTQAILFPQNGSGNGPLWDRYDTNQTPSWYYFGDSSTNYLPNAAKAYYAQGTPPIWRGIGGQWGGILDVQVPPSAGSFGGVGSGYLFHVGCNVQGQDAKANEPPCRRATNPIFPFFEVLRVDGLHGRRSFGYDDNSGGWSFTGTNVNVNGHAVCLANGDNCPGTPNITGYTMKFQIGPSAFNIGTTYYIGELSLLTTNNSAAYRAPANCAVDTVTASEMLATGEPPGSEQPQYTLFDVTANAVISQISFPWTGAGQNTFTFTNQNKNIAAGDLLQVQIITPFWGTPPTGTLAFSSTVYCK